MEWGNALELPKSLLPILNNALCIPISDIKGWTSSVTYGGKEIPPGGSFSVHYKKKSLHHSAGHKDPNTSAEG